MGSQIAFQNCPASLHPPPKWTYLEVEQSIHQCKVAIHSNLEQEVKKNVPHWRHMVKSSWQNTYPEWKPGQNITTRTCMIQLRRGSTMSLEEVRALSFTSWTGAGHCVKAHIQNCLKREKTKNQYADCHFWSLSFKKKGFLFCFPLLSCRKERLYWTSVHTVFHFTGSPTHFEVNMNCKRSIQGGKLLKWVQDYS